MLKLLLIGWITVASSVGGADVMVDEQDGIRMHGKQICLEVEAGRHLIMVDKNGYEPFIDTLIVHQGKNTELNVWMQPKSFRQGFAIRWCGIGGGLGTGLDLHLSIANMRLGWFSLEPCLWGMNLPYFSGLSHVKSTWMIPPRDRRSDAPNYQTVVSTPNLQFYYTPMLGMQIPLKSRSVAIAWAAGPQISWTNIHWSEPQMADYYQFDPVWFSVKAGVLFKRWQSDLMVYLKYQDGYFIGVDFLF